MTAAVLQEMQRLRNVVDELDAALTSAERAAREETAAERYGRSLRWAS